MANVEVPPAYVDDVGIWAGAEYLNMLLRAAVDIDGWTFRRAPALLSSGSYGQGPTYNALHTNAQTAYRVWKGYFLWRTGYTQLHMEGLLATFVAPVKMKTYVNGVLKNTINLGVPTTFNFDIDITSGYTNGQVVPVEVWIDGEGNTATTRFGKWELVDAWTGPLSKSGYPGVPTFTTTIDATRINQLSNAIMWLFDRLAMVPYVPGRSQRYIPGPYRDPAVKPEMANWFYLDAGFLKSYSSGEVIRLAGTFTHYNTSQQITVDVNGSTAYTSPTYGPGSYEYSIPIALTGSAGVRSNVRVWWHVVTPGANTVTPSMISTYLMRSEPDGGGYPFASPPAYWDGNANMSFTTMVSRLNAIGAMLTAAKARIDGAPHLFSRLPLLPRWPGYDDDSHQKLDRRSVVTFVRNGGRLLVVGQDVKIAYGPITVPSDDEGAKPDDWKQEIEETVVDSDKLDSNVVYLDTFEGLDVGMVYNLKGNVLYAEEYLDS